MLDGRGAVPQDGDMDEKQSAAKDSGAQWLLKRRAQLQSAHDQNMGAYLKQKKLVRKMEHGLAKIEGAMGELDLLLSKAQEPQAETPMGGQPI